MESNASNSATRPMRLLSIDGGGLKGLIPAEALIAIETQLDALTGRSLPLSDRFDLIGGHQHGRHPRRWTGSRFEGGRTSGLLPQIWKADFHQGLFDQAFLAQLSEWSARTAPERCFRGRHHARKRQAAYQHRHRLQERYAGDDLVLHQ
jgi:hypothetical protein